MPDGKYGRLFTESDVRVLIALAYSPAVRSDWRAVPERLIELAAESSGLTFPADEPLFLLRGQDAAAPEAIYEPGMVDPTRACCYQESCLRQGASAEHVAAVRLAADAMRAWQREHPDRVKVPD